MNLKKLKINKFIYNNRVQVFSKKRLINLNLNFRFLSKNLNNNIEHIVGYIHQGLAKEIVLRESFDETVVNFHRLVHIISISIKSSVNCSNKKRRYYVH